MPEGARVSDPLAELRARLEATRAAAEQLAGEAIDAGDALRSGQEPPPSWASHADRDALREDVGALVGLVRTLAEILPPELREQLTEIARQLLVALRVLIDWALEQLPRAAEPEQQLRDIPIA